MTFLLVAGVWFGVAFLTCLVFAALVRGGRSGQPDPEDDRVAGEPAQASGDGSRRVVGP